MDNPGFFAVVPANVRYCEDLKPNAKLLYGEITALCNKDGYCWAENSYFAGLYNVSTETVSRWISQLHSFGFISVELIKSEGNKRKITIDNNVNSYRRKSQDLLTKKSIPLDKKSKSYIRINNTINNTNNREGTPLSFLEKNYPSRYEVLIMNYQSKIKDFHKAVEAVNLTIVKEQLEWVPDVIDSRCRLFFNRWVENQIRYEAPVQTTETDNQNKIYKQNRF